MFTTRHLGEVLPGIIAECPDFKYATMTLLDPRHLHDWGLFSCPDRAPAAAREERRRRRGGGVRGRKPGLRVTGAGHVSVPNTDLGRDRGSRHRPPAGTTRGRHCARKRHHRVLHLNSALPHVDAVAGATRPRITRHGLFRRSRAGSTFFVEKPMTTCSASAQRLIDAAGERGLTLMVGFRYRNSNAAVWELREVVDSGEFGDIYYIHCARPGSSACTSRTSTSIWDLAPHDLSIVNPPAPREPPRRCRRGVPTTRVVPGGRRLSTAGLRQSATAHADPRELARSLQGPTGYRGGKPEDGATTTCWIRNESGSTTRASSPRNRKTRVIH